MYNDNRDLKPKVIEKTKYHPRIKSTVNAFIKKFPDKSLKIIDIGARDGYSVELLKKAGYKVFGTELIEGFVRHAIKHHRAVVWDDMMDSNLPSGRVDVIFSRHCIEHCRDSLTFLRTCERVLKRGGHLFMTFPLETKKDFNARKDVGKNHMVYFKDKDAFRNIIRETGIVEIEFGKSKRYGIIPDKREVLFIGRVDA
jgi:2-polyprenyl-3-methyl-5-hydroxy-6-metoxy-1,4-benzoquinol methylase